MIRILLLSFLLATNYFAAYAQQLPLEWVRSFQGQGKASDRIASVITDPAGNVYVAGYAGNHHGAPDAFAMKRNPQGDTLWTYYYDGGNNNEDYASDIVVDILGNAYITGHSTATSTFIQECFTAKILPSGVEAWVMRYSPGGNTESFGNALAVDTLGNVYVAGYTDPFPGSNDWLVIKYNASGLEQWVDVFNDPDNGEDEALDIAISPNGNPTVCGYIYTASPSGSFNAFVKQYTPANGTVWTDTWSNPSFTGLDKAYGLGFIASGDLLVGGETTNSSSNNRDAFAMRYDPAGNRQWATIYADSITNVDEYLRQVIVDDFGNVYFTGTDYQDADVTRINSNGTPGWRKEWKGNVSNGTDVFHGVTVDNSGNVYATGRGVYPGEDYYGNGGMTNMIIAKYNSSGDSVWTYRSKDSLTCSMGFAITALDGKVYAGGYITDTAYINENLYTIILDTAGNSINEWIYNGRGDAITMGQFVQTDANDNVYCAATVDRLYDQGYDVVLVKYDPAGTLLWEKYYSSYGWNNDTLTAMQFDPSGNLILSISTDSSLLRNNFRLSLLKVNQNGDFLDTTWYGGSSTGSLLARSMAIRNDGSIALAASSSIDGGVIIYFDATFNVGWTAKIDSAQFALTRANCVDFFPNGDLAVGGYSQNGSVTVGLVQRYDASGTKLWSSAIDSATVYDEIFDITVNATGDLAFTGASGLINSYATLLGKLEGTTGNQLWKKLYNPATNYERGVKLRFTPAGDVVYICRGWTGSVARYTTGQYSDAGVFQWAITYSMTASDREPVDLIVEPSNRVVTAGWAINGFSTNYDYVLAGYSSTGAIEFINTYSDSLPVSFSWDQLRDLTRDSHGNFIVTGQSSHDFFNNYLYKMLTIKYGGIVLGSEDISAPIRQMLVVYPNPSQNGRFTLIDASPNPITSGRVYDIQGKFITTLDLSNWQIDLGGCRPGLYVVSLQRDNLPAEHLRLIVN